VAETGSTLSVTTVATSPAVLSMALGVPGPQGNQGEPGQNGTNGQGVAAGGLVNQVLVKLSNDDYDTGWANGGAGGDYLPLSGGTMSGTIFLPSLRNLLNTDLTVTAYNDTGAGTNFVHTFDAFDGTFALATNGGGLKFPDDTVQVTAGLPLTGGEVSGSTTFLNGIIIDAGTSIINGTVYFTNLTHFENGLDLTFEGAGITFFDNTTQTTAFPPAGGTSAQYIDGVGGLVEFPEVGDRYLSSSTTTLTIGNGAKTLTIGTGLSYSTQQDVTIAYDASNHMHATVTSYNSGTGVMVCDVFNKTGSGTYSAWTINVGGVVGGSYLQTANNLSELTATASTARTNLGLGAVSTDAYATNLQAVQNTSSTTVLSPANSRFASISTNIWSPGVTGLTAATSGTGANAGSTVTSLNGSLIPPNASTAGYATRGFNLYFPSNSINNGYNFGTASGHSVRVFSGSWASTVTGVKMRAVFGRMSAALPVPATLAVRGYGWEWDFSTKVISIIAHNGTTLTTTAQTWTPVSFRTYDIAVYSNGAGTISLYIDGTLIGTGTGGPTDTSTTNQIWWQMEIQNEATAGIQQTIYYQNPKLITTNG
jgi:hypothetical protein